MELKIKAGILTVSDKASRGEREDRSGPALRGLLEAAGAEVARTAIVPDEQDEIRAVLTAWSDEGLDRAQPPRWDAGGDPIRPRPRDARDQRSDPRRRAGQDPDRDAEPGRFGDPEIDADHQFSREREKRPRRPGGRDRRPAPRRRGPPRRRRRLRQEIIRGTVYVTP